MNRLSRSLVIFAVLSFAAPVFAHSVSQPLDLTQLATFGDATLKPGHYKFTADLASDQVRVIRDGRIVATIEGKAVTLNYKVPYDAVVFNGRRVHQIQFEGKTEAINIPNS